MRFFMIILGIDPGIAIVGYGVIEYSNQKSTVLDFGAVTTEAHTPLELRLKQVYMGLNALIARYQPKAVAVEELFFNNNAKTAIAVGQGRGVCLLCASLHDIPVYEYTPLQVKMAIAGYGRADKLQIQNMVKILLNLKTIPKPDDAADALAIALCHAGSVDYQTLAERAKKR